MTTIGMIYPDHAAEDEYPCAAALLRVNLPVAHVYGTDLHAVPELLDLGSPDKLAGGLAQLADSEPDAVMWACTSGSFVYGAKGAEQQSAALAAAAGVPAGSTSQAFVAALHHLEISHVAIAASYPWAVATLFVEYLAAFDITVVAVSSAGIDTAAQVGTLDAGQVLDLAVSNDHQKADALLIPDTAMHTLAVVPELETRLGKPVLTANQVTIWHGLRLAGVTPSAAALGTLFSREAPHDPR